MRKLQFESGEIYHVWNRGVNREPIFFSRANRIFFLAKLKQYFQPCQTATILAYCLMSNHFHLLIECHTEQFGRHVMQPLGISYTKSVNKEQARVGPLFQGPFKAKHVNYEAYLAGLSRYIHLNPVTAGLVRHPDAWEFSSYREYAGLRKGTLPHPRRILSLFDTINDYTDFVTSNNDPQSGFPTNLLFE